MNLWKLERLRLIRTHRIWLLLGIFVFFGALGPLTARYLAEIVDRLGAGADVPIPPASPELAMSQFAGNAIQIGLLAVVFVAAAALAFDAKREMAVFLRTRAPVEKLLAPRYVISVAASVLSLIAGTAVAYAGSAFLIAAPDGAGTVAGTLLVALYLIFVIAVTGMFASIVRGVPATALLSIGSLIVLGLGSLIPAVGRWLPSELVGGFDALIAGGPFIYWPSIATTVVLTTVAVGVSVVRMRNREV